MNKTKRNIIQLRINFVLKMASQITPFEKVDKWYNGWYVKNAKTPVQVAGEVKQSKKSKLNKIYYAINDYNMCGNMWGNMFDVKFPMIVCICKLDINQAYNSYQTYLDSHAPRFSQAPMNAVKHYFAKRCKSCGCLYWKKEITSEQFDNFPGNDNIDVSFANDAWTGEITSCCDNCADDYYNDKS